jgi:hypothetical protein
MDNRKKLTIAIVIFISLSLAAVIVAVIIKSTQPQLEKRVSTTTTDPVSGEQVIKGTNTGVASPDATPNTPTYLGFSNLVDRGVSIQQVEIIKAALTSYSLNNKAIFTQVSLNKDNINRVMPSSPDDPSELTFPIVVNNKDNYFVSASYSTPDTMTTKLYKSDQTTLLFTQ